MEPSLAAFLGPDELDCVVVHACRAMRVPWLHVPLAHVDAAEDALARMCIIILRCFVRVAGRVAGIYPSARRSTTARGTERATASRRTMGSSGDQAKGGAALLLEVSGELWLDGDVGMDGGRGTKSGLVVLPVTMR